MPDMHADEAATEPYRKWYDHQRCTFGRNGLKCRLGFIVQKSKNKRRVRQLEGLNGEQAFLIVADHYSDILYGMAAGSKAPPLAWMNRLLTELIPGNERGKYVTMDLGGEMARKSDVRRILKTTSTPPVPQLLGHRTRMHRRRRLYKQLATRRELCFRDPTSP